MQKPAPTNPDARLSREPGGVAAQAIDVLTIGHSNHTIDRFIDLLKGQGVTVLADVRSIPASRFAPQFRQAALKASLNAVGIGYVWLGEGLGGKPRDKALWREGAPDFQRIAVSPAFRAGLDTLRTVIAEARVAIMCAEREPKDCHRARLVAPELDRAGLRVGHILADGDVLPHRSFALSL
jgi:uncharacterized protein (DUF488 family)